LTAKKCDKKDLTEIKQKMQVLGASKESQELKNNLV
jgi:hypothetical protein